MVKENAPELLRKELLSPRWQPRVLAISGVTDAYQPIERKLQLTRRCLHVLAEFRNPIAIITKNHLVTRDVDYIGELARHNAAVVCISVTTLDAELARKMEPRTTQPAGRLRAIETLANAGIPVGVMVAPLIPGLTDHEMPQILKAARNAGASEAGYVLVRLPLGNSDLFPAWLDMHFPEKKERVLGRVRELRQGRLNDSTFGRRMRGEGAFADLFEELFAMTKRRLGFRVDHPGLSSAAFRRPNDTPRLLFDEGP
jgi:DNA repair photolyase